VNVDALRVPPFELCYTTPRIQISADVRQDASDAWDALKSFNDPPSLFWHLGGLALIAHDEQGRPLARMIGVDLMRYVLARVIDWRSTREKRGKTEDAKALPPIHVVKDMLARPDPPLPPLRRIIEAPTFALDGTLHNRPGYHAATECYLDPAPELAGLTVPERPSASEIDAGRTLLVDELLGDFPFVDAAGRAHAVALMLCPFCRQMIDGPTPLHMIDKNSPGTGGTLLLDVAALIATGRNALTLTIGRDPEETRKRLTSFLRGGPVIIGFDNVHTLDSGDLSALLTARTWRDRILGQSETIDLPIESVFVATGNNIVTSTEIARRVARTRLDAKVDRPWLRGGFRHDDLRQWVLDHRADLVRAALTLIQAWIVAGRPATPKTLGMFEAWARTIGGVLRVAGIDGFLENIEALYEESDHEGATWRAFTAAWHARHDRSAVTASDLYDLAEGLDLGTGSERSQKTRLGKMLAKMRDRRFGALRVEEAGFSEGRQRWRVALDPSAPGF
jgi:putative DNA primase/helicase